MTDTPAEQRPAKAPGRDSLLSAEDNRRMFNRIARRYDFMNRLLSLRQDVVSRAVDVRKLQEELRKQGCIINEGDIEKANQPSDTA